MKKITEWLKGHHVTKKVKTVKTWGCNNLTYHEKQTNNRLDSNLINGCAVFKTDHIRFSYLRKIPAGSNVDMDTFSFSEDLNVTIDIFQASNDEHIFTTPATRIADNLRIMTNRELTSTHPKNKYFPVFSKHEKLKYHYLKNTQSNNTQSHIKNSFIGYFLFLLTELGIIFLIVSLIFPNTTGFLITSFLVILCIYMVFVVLHILLFRDK